jgi:hypothetical protein
VQLTDAILPAQIRLLLQETGAVAIDPMSSRSTTSVRIQLAVFGLFALATVAISLSIDLSKFQERVSTREDQAILQGISSPSELESALRQHPSNSVLQLMAKAIKAADNTKVAVDQLSAQIEPARLSKELNFSSVSRDELDAFRGDLRTAEANARAYLPRYAAIFKTELDQIRSATVSFHVPRSIADQLLEGVTQRQARTLNAISLVLSARADYYRAYDKYIAFLSSELGSFKIVGGQFIFPLQRTVERYNVAAQAMTSAGRRVNELETDMKKLERPLPEEWARLTGAN